MRRLLRVNLKKKTYAWEELNSTYKKYAGHGLITSILFNEMDPKADALGPDNKLIIAPGLLSGTPFPNANRVSIGAKSPLTGGIKEANSGGSAAKVLAQMGIAAVVFEDVADEWTSVKVTIDSAIFEDASALVGKGNYDILNTYNNDYASVISIGQAGEKLAKGSSISVGTSDGHPRMAARGGIGAVMGSKKLKLVLLDDTGAGKVEIPADKKDVFRENTRAMSKAIMDFPMTGGLKALGTAVLVNLVDQMGCAPTKNFRYGRCEGHEKLSGEYMMELSQKRPNFVMTHKCSDGCLVSCSNILTDEKGNLLCASVEYETLALVGTNCCITDLDAVARINYICNDVGVDTMEIGCALAICMDAGLLAWGDGDAAVKLTAEMRAGTERGSMLIDGAQATGEKLGVTRIPTVKRQALAGYDPRFLKGTGVTYATSPMGADHTSGNIIPTPDGDYNPIAQTGQGPVSTFVQRHNTAVDCMGFCLFPYLVCCAVPALYQHINACAGIMLGEDVSENYFIELGADVINMELKFNETAGITKADDKLPDFFYTEKLDTCDQVFDVDPKEIEAVHDR